MAQDFDGEAIGQSMTSQVMAPRSTRPTFLAMLLRPLLLATLSCLPACNAQRFFMTTAVGGLSDYFDHPSSAEETLDEVAPGVFTFQSRWERALIVQTPDGLVVTDTFNPTFSRALRSRLERDGLWQPVRTVIYSHHHLDHVGGAAVLEPAEVLAHADAPAHWAATKPRDLLPPTRLVRGDTTLHYGARRIDLVAIPHAHAETHFAILVDNSVLYAPDTIAPGVMLLGGLPSVPLAGYFADMQRLQGLDFEVFVASHFGYAPKDEFVRTVAMMRDLDAIGQGVIAEHRVDGGFRTDKSTLKRAFKDYYDRTHAKYGDWHGFDTHILGTFIRIYTADLLGDTAPVPSPGCNAVTFDGPRCTNSGHLHPVPKSP
ncbi:MAG: MBL fold metallo-hydrolase [Nannocystaceae bacterium]|nr:MBL fold metallo-hydrolase [Nannocystaceae bacterium]